jgi:quercetin 2,3-dioxygenase
MPAISADTVALPRIPEPGLEALDRQVISVTTAPSGFEGEGFPVRRAFAGVDLRTIDPFVHMDQMGEVDYAPGEPRARPGTPTAGSRP